MGGFRIAESSIEIFRDPVAVRPHLLEDIFRTAPDAGPLCMELILGQGGDDEVADGRRLGLRLIESA